MPRPSTSSVRIGWWPRSWGVAWASSALVACTHGPVATGSVPPEPVTPTIVADPCAGLDPSQAVAEAEADVQAHRVDTYERHARTLAQAQLCRATSGDPDEALEVAAVLAAMAEDAVARGSLERGHALTMQAREVYAAVADRTDDRALARTAAEAQFDLVARIFGELPATGDPPRGQSCRVQSEGYCVVREHKRPPPDWVPLPERTPYDEVERVQLVAHEVYEAHAEPGERLRSRRYRRLATLMKHRDYAAAVPGLERYVLDYDGHRSAAWAATMLLDALVNQRFMLGDEDAHAALMQWSERLPTLSLWLDDDARGLRNRMPVIRAALMWQTAVQAREEGKFAMEALHDASRAHTGAPPDPEPHFLRCAAIFLEIHDAFPDHDRADTLLWNAADCYDAAWRPVLATAVRQRLRLEYPSSNHAQDALRSIVENEQRLLRLESAAAHGLEFARRYPKAPEAPAMLLRALPVEVALGHATNTAEIVDLYAKAYARKHPPRVAQLVWSRRPEEPEALLVYAEDYLRRYGRYGFAGKVDALRVVHELRWARACDHRLVDGLCVARVQPRPSAACTLGGTPMPLVRARRARRQQEAAVAVQRTLAALQMVHTDVALRPEVVPFTRRARASAAFHALEPELEAYLRDGPLCADGLARVETLDEGYAAVAALGDVERTIAAHARRALAWERLANQHLVRRDGRCVPSSPQARTLVARATQAYRDCLALAVETQHFDDTARRCERALTAIEPDVVPPRHEFVPRPAAYEAPTMTAVGVVTDPWSQP